MTKEDKLKQSIIEVLNDPNTFTKYDEQKNMFVILVNGKRVKMKSGKTFWNAKGAAKNALWCHLESISYSKIVRDAFLLNEDGFINYSSSRKIIKEIESEWIGKHVVIVPFADYFNLKNKKSK